MLILGRREGQTIILDGNIRITILELRGEHVRLGIDAPREVSIYREEVLVQLDHLNRDASRVASEDVALVPREGRKSTNRQQRPPRLQSANFSPDA